MRQASEPRLFVVRSAPPMDDAALVEAVATGDPAAPGFVWDRYAAVVRGVLRRSLGVTDVEDHVQEVFLRFFRHARELRDPSALRSFLIGIAIRVAGSELRRRRVRRFLSFTPSGDVPGSAVPPLDAEAREAVVRLYAILDRLDPGTRLVFVLRHVEALELSELAAALGVSLATAKRRVARATDRVLGMARRDGRLVPYLPESGRAARKGSP